MSSFQSDLTSLKREDPNWKKKKYKTISQSGRRNPNNSKLVNKTRNIRT